MESSVRIKNKGDIEQLRTSGRILSEVLSALGQEAKEGVSLLRLEELAGRLIEEKGAEPAFLGYRAKEGDSPYPAAICASLNDEIVHCIPNERSLKSGDVLKIDLGISYKGYITDSAITVAIGEIDPKASELIKITKLALEKAMGECKAGKRVGDIGWVIENTVSSAGFSVVERLTGHGVGFELHEPPSVHNYGEKNTGLLLEPGMVLAIEPMVAIGSGEIREDSRGGFITRDGSLAAHFEHTVLITEGDPEVLTN